MKVFFLFYTYVDAITHVTARNIAFRYESTAFFSEIEQTTDEGFATIANYFGKALILYD